MNTIRTRVVAVTATLFAMLVTVLTAYAPSAFATTEQVTITQGSGADQSCVVTANCFEPNNIQITVGDTVTWVNQDSIGHTVTSGNPSDTQTGTIFDSSLISSGRTFSFTFTQARTYPYFDMIHAWMTGTITVIPSATQTNSESQSSVPSTTSNPSTVTSPIQYNIPYWIKNDARWWSEGQISDNEFVKAIQYLIDNDILTPNQAINEISQLQQENQDLNQRLQYYEEYLKQYKANVTNAFQQYQANLTNIVQQYQANVTNMVQLLQCLPQTTIYNQTLSWHFCDSKGNKYDWSMPIRTYDYQTKRPYPTLSLIPENTSNGTGYALDYTPFVEKDFSKVIDQVYDNSGSNSQFLYNVWYIVSQFTPYSKDITTSNVWPLETFTRAGGDCKDTTILTADMIRSSSHTADWKLRFIYVNAENPTSNLPSNHVFLEVTTSDGNVYTIETTDKIDGFDYWNGKQYNYWYVDVP